PSASASGCHGPCSGSGPLSLQGPPFPQNAARERSRVQALRRAFLSLQAALPAVPPGTKLSKLDVLVLATSYIAHLSHELGRGPPPPAPSRPFYGHPLLHPLKKWPMRSRLYAGPCG
ncbi:TCF23 factor, partial [Galbula dea]|nr:TCF23 factor [Galbula dea]